MKFNLSGKQKSANISLPKAAIVHGIEVRKVPIGRYLTAMRELEELPGIIIGELFPGKTISDIFAEITTITDEKLLQVTLKLITVAPEHIIEALAMVLDVDKTMLMDTLTPKELCDVIREYWSMNEMSDFFGVVLGLIKKKLPALPIPNTGSSAGSPLAKH